MAEMAKREYRAPDFLADMKDLAGTKPMQELGEGFDILEHTRKAVDWTSGLVDKALGVLGGFVKGVSEAQQANFAKMAQLDPSKGMTKEQLDATISEVINVATITRPAAVKQLSKAFGERKGWIEGMLDAAGRIESPRLRDKAAGEAEQLKRNFPIITKAIRRVPQELLDPITEVGLSPKPGTRGQLNPVTLRADWSVEKGINIEPGSVPHEGLHAVDVKKYRDTVGWTEDMNRRVPPMGYFEARAYPFGDKMEKAMAELMPGEKISKETYDAILKQVEKETVDRWGSNAFEYDMEEVLKHEFGKRKGASTKEELFELEGKSDNVTHLITKPVRDFHRSFREKINLGIEELSKKVGEYKDWKFNIGDRAQGKTGDGTPIGLEIIGRSWNMKDNRPLYWVKDSMGGKGTANAELAHEKWIKLSGPEGLVKKENEVEDLFELSGWHGGRELEGGKFSSEKVGTGQGLAVGWGTYVSDLEEVGRHYAERAYDNLDIYDTKKVHIVIDTLLGDEKLPKFYKDALVNVLESSGRKAYSVLESVIGEAKARKLLKDAGIDYNAQLHKVTAFKGKTPEEHPWLDWDKPLSEQSEETKKALENLPWNNPLKENFNTKDISGADLYRTLQDYFGGSRGSMSGTDGAKAASEALRKAGIAGNRYPTGMFDQRPTPGKYNYVIFEPEAIEVEKSLPFSRKGE